jgi:hypothetical protein
MSYGSHDTLLRQASLTAEDYFLKAIIAIDEKFGEGYAKKNPDLIAAFMKTASVDFATTSISKLICEELVNRWID